ncbi:MAG: hypothetical protein LQ347_000105 [Umbilicaria vellea]|nr:MAG: hypothetical protein LQ347_000105 [Umbilicaria vellea]
MASFPPQPSSSQRRQDSQNGRALSPSAPDIAAQLGRRSSRARSVTSEDSQTVLLNNPSSSTSSPTLEQGKTEHAQGPLEDNEPRKCWICFADETEDTPTSSAWRSPCPCALTAHESCLLDWVADLEAPGHRKRSGSSAKIQCPQCKSNIAIARPRSLIVEGVSAVEYISGRLVVPGIFITVAGSVLTGCWVHGLSTVFMIFGKQDAIRLLGLESPDGVSARWGFGLPLIPIVLVLSRTTLADNLLPVLPILFFATQSPQNENLDLTLWPPSAAMTVAALPYIRGAYNEVFKRLFAERQKRWNKEVQPRAGETGEDGTPGNGQDAGLGGQADVDEGLNFELNVEVEIIEEEEEEADLGNNQQQQGNNANDGAAVAQGDAGQNQAQVPAVQPPRPRQNNLVITTSQLADTFVGALAFPTISAAMGAILKATLPKTWTNPPSLWDRRRAGLLQTRWGRTIVGGCLFVVLKDTLLLYSRYRLAQDHRKRKVLDYDRKKGKATGR